MISSFRSAILGAVGILVVSAALAVAANMAIPGGIPLVARPMPASAPKLSFEKVWEAHDKGEAVFIDARPAPEYEAGHITGARNVPMLERSKFRNKLMRDVPSTAQVIIYCDGAECEASEKVAAWMLGSGWRNVSVFGDGFPAWRDAGMPVSEGNKP